MAALRDGPTLDELLSTGSLFEGKYRILGHIGAGSFAYVLRARHEIMDRDVALKVLKPEIVRAHPDVATRFVNEVRIVSKLRHPNTVTVFDFGTTEDGISYMVMELVDGRSLEDELEEGAMELDRVVHITKQILKSLDEAHAAGIVHRDLKPSNIMLTDVHGERDLVKVLDFGVAKLVTEENEKRRRKTSQFERRSTQFIGTPIYMSPEQVLGERVVPASDLYSLGLIVYEMLTGENPVEAPNVAAVAQVHIDDEPIPFPSLDRLTPRFQKLILRATARRLDARFRTVKDFARQLPQLGSQDFSDEFAILLGEERSRPPSNEPSEGEDDFLEIFSGRNYLAPPSESEIAADLEPPPRPLRPLPTPTQPEPEVRRPARREELSLDVGRLRRDQLRRERTARAEVSQSGAWQRREVGREIGWYVAGLASLLVSFMVASTVFVDEGGAGRVLVGVLPMLGAVLGVSFSPTRPVSGGARVTHLVPLAKYLCVAAVVTVVGVALLFPESAATRLEHDGAWFVSHAADDSVVRRAIEAVSRGFSALFSFASRVTPW